MALLCPAILQGVAGLANGKRPSAATGPQKRKTLREGDPQRIFPTDEGDVG